MFSGRSAPGRRMTATAIVSPVVTNRQSAIAFACQGDDQCLRVPKYDYRPCGAIPHCIALSF